HGPAATFAFPVEESPHVGQERDELAVVTCLELIGRAVEVVARLAPGMRAFRLLEQIPGLLDLRAFANRHELQRPEQDLPEVANELGHGLDDGRSGTRRMVPMRSEYPHRAASSTLPLRHGQIKRSA